MNSARENLIVQQVFGSLTNHFQTYTNKKECEKYVQSVSKDHRILLIVAGRSGSLIVPRIHQFLQVSVIFYRFHGQKK